MATRSRGVKRKSSISVLAVEPSSISSKDTQVGPSLLLLEVPAEANISLPVWEAMRSKHVDITWTTSPYSVSVRFTPLTSQQGWGAAASGQGESTSAQSPPPHTAVQFASQQDGPSQKRSSVVVTLSQNIQVMPCPTSHLQNALPDANPSTSFIASLPLLISQPQPADQPAKTEIQPTAETSRTAACKLWTQSEVPAPLLFHTKTCFNIPICDKFLLSTCHAGTKCKMHHTPYPFHWQLWCNVTHQWVDVSHRAQVILERNYCDVSQEIVHLKDGQLCYTLNFDSMELDDCSKYDTVRRLTNSDSLVKNPYFPSRWKIYWWNNVSWEEYSKTLSTWLLQKMDKKEPECSFTIGSQEYNLDFTSMTQTNVATGYQREVRCRPVYRSPESMRPYLQTGIQADPPLHHSPAANFSVDPLEEFSSWYPPVWFRATEQDYDLVEVPAGTLAYRTVQNLFHESLPETRVDVLSIQQVQNQLHWDKYQRQKVYMEKLHTRSKKPLERHLFHGTTKEASEVICHSNFDPRVAGTNGSAYGLGSYFSTTSSLSHTYSTKAAPDDVRHMFLAKVLVGKVSLGRDGYRRPPPRSFARGKPYVLYDACVDDVVKPSVFVVFDSCQCYPYYLIKYKDVPKEVDI